MELNAKQGNEQEDAFTKICFFQKITFRLFAS